MNAGQVSIKYENANIDVLGTEEERRDGADYLNLIKYQLFPGMTTEGWIEGEKNYFSRRETSSSIHRMYTLYSL